MKFVKQNFYFLVGTLFLLIANIPSVVIAYNTGQTAPFSYLVLIEIGMLFYVLDAILANRPKIFMITGIINLTLNLIVILLSGSV